MVSSTTFLDNRNYGPSGWYRGAAVAYPDQKPVSDVSRETPHSGQVRPLPMFHVKHGNPGFLIVEGALVRTGASSGHPCEEGLGVLHHYVQIEGIGPSPWSTPGCELSP